MRHLAAVGRVAVVAVSASTGLFAAPRPAAAECTFVPPLPKISFAVPTARELFVGEVIANGSGTSAIFTVRVDEVLRGAVKVGDVRVFQYAEPNWPWTKGTGEPYASCNSLLANRGETVAVAIGARWPGGTLHEYGQTWYQPPTTFQTVALIVDTVGGGYDVQGRQRFSLKRLRELAAIGPPPTDALAAPTSAAPRAWPPGLIALVAAGLLGGALGWHRTRRST